MLVLLGKRDAIQAYFDVNCDRLTGKHLLEKYFQANIFRQGSITSAKGAKRQKNCIDQIVTIKKYTPRILVTQSLEFLDTLLESNLDFNIMRTTIVNGQLLTCEMTKQEVKQNREAWAFDPR